MRLTDRQTLRSVIFPEEEFDLTIGRSSDCDIKVPVLESNAELSGIIAKLIKRSQVRVSREHARLVGRDGGCYLTDCDSKNGTVVKRRDGSVYNVGEEPFELESLDKVGLSTIDFPTGDYCFTYTLGDEDFRKHVQTSCGDIVGLDLRGGRK